MLLYARELVKVPATNLPADDWVDDRHTPDEK
jgi:hypothetical protein